MFRKTITALTLAAATVAGVVIAAPAQAATGCSAWHGSERLCVNRYSYTGNYYTSVNFTIWGPDTDYRITAGSSTYLYTPGTSSIGVDGHYTGKVCISEATTHWSVCV
ncbi:hypothetical protein OHS33_21260 [Streptomyces sp. NBC_00536]|uniref:hypothetical protein n=1 Tax=Streptomyces sp. NBC_00536 TaxID=2975769 RepID=UPI002E803502|nr:hypothetical protein [Streptomyces sp. NBC_00536]WUC80626.1 hypothetical protein OHS33_21260 [Streptomyces sp. NBC_00536]